MMLRYSFSLEEEARAIENAINAVLGQGLRTADLASGGAYISTGEMGAFRDLIQSSQLPC